MIYAANFSLSRIDVFSSSYGLLNLAGAFIDPNLPAGYAPFGIRVLGGEVYVTYALQQNLLDDQPGPGNGYVDKFDLAGNFVQRLVSQGASYNFV